MQKRELITNPFTLHLRKEFGMSLRGWADVNNLSRGMTSQVVNAGAYVPEIIERLRDRELYYLLPRLVRDKIEKRELLLKERKESLHG